MNKIVLPLFGLLLLSLFSCNLKDETPAPDTKKNILSVFPVTEFLEGQIKSIEKSPVTLLKITTAEGIADSAWFSRESIRGFAGPFLTPVIDSATLSPYFDGQSFIDQTINSVTFTYDANQSLPGNIFLKTIDVYADPESGGVTKVYLLKETYLNKVLTKVQLTWKTDQWCSIRTIVQKDEENPVIKEEKVIWKFD